MADIFVSYKKSDHHRVAPLVAFLELQGWSVWWDTQLEAGERWDEVIERELESASCVVVVWTRDSVDSRWVRTEALEGAERGVLVPLLLDVDKPPFGFELFQYLNITGWSGNDDALTARQIVEAISRLVGRPIVGRKPQPRVATTKTEIPKNERRMYLYISDDKLASLAPETSLQTTQERVSVIPRVLADLRSQGLVGNDAPYMENELVMKWGLVDFGVCDNDVRVAVFYNEERNLLLCGSTKHVVSPTSTTYRYPPRYFGFSGSNLPGIIKFVSGMIGIPARPFDETRSPTDDRNVFLQKVAPHLVEQQVYFVARLFGEKFGLMMGSPIFVALSNAVQHKKRTPSRVIDHLKVDSEEIAKVAQEREVQRQEQKRRNALKQLCKEINKLSTDSSLSNYHKAIHLYLKFCKRFDMTPIPANKKEIPLKFASFLRNREVISFVLNDLEGSPFLLDEMFYAAAEIGMKDEAINLFERIMEINYYIPGIDVCVYIESHKAGYWRPVLERWRDHPEPSVRRWVRRALESMVIGNEIGP